MITFATINIDGIEVNREFTSIQEIKNDWYSDKGTSLPSLDDELLLFTVNNENINIKPKSTFSKVIEHLKIESHIN